jgi:hypothetical protein
MRFLYFSMMAFASLLSAQAVQDCSIVDFPRLKGERDDAPRFQRAVDACRGGGVLSVPSGNYTFAKTLFVTNLCSVELSAGARIKAVAKMEWMVKIDQMWQWEPKTAPRDVNPEIYNLAWRGGTLDADGKASCIAIDNFRHFTLENATFLNGRKYGVGIETTGRGYEMVARNIYIKTLIPGLAGNVGLYSKSGDSHYTDIIVVDYTTGVHFAGDASNWLTRIHVWGGLAGHPPKKGELPEMLKNSVCFRIDAASTFMRDCYADTGAICYWINGWECRMDGCYSYNNPWFKLNDVLTIRQDNGSLWCDNCMFNRMTPETRLYEGRGDAKIAWGDNNIFRYFWKAPRRKLPPSREPVVWKGEDR